MTWHEIANQLDQLESELPSDERRGKSPLSRALLIAWWLAEDAHRFNTDHAGGCSACGQTTHNNACGVCRAYKAEALTARRFAGGR
jgi:hypothetical protein